MVNLKEQIVSFLISDLKISDAIIIAARKATEINNSNNKKQTKESKK